MGLEVSELLYHPQGWRYGAKLTDLSLPALEVWRLYRGQADCENQTFRLLVARKRRPWFEGLLANAGEPVKRTPVPSTLMRNAVMLTFWWSSHPKHPQI